MTEYSKLLDELIFKSKLSLTDISEKCEEIGVKVTVSYLSKLRNGKMPAPSAKVSAVLAKALDYPAEKLIAAALIDDKEKNKEELDEALKMVYPDIDQEELFEKLVQLTINPESLIHLRKYPTGEELEQMNKISDDTFKYDSGTYQEYNLKNLLENKTIKWGEETLSEEEKEKAINMLKILFGDKKDTH